MHRTSMVLAAGADFRLMGGKETMLKARVPVVSVCAVRTGCGKSQTSRRVSDILREMGKKVVVVRHPMPYGDLVRQACQRFATYEDLDRHQCTIEAASPIFVEEPEAIRGKNVLVVEDGPTLTHGEMAYGAGIVAARRFGAAQIIDSRPYAVGSIVETFKKYPQTGPLLPAMGYGQKQIEELGETINNTPCDLVIVATPIDLRRLVEISHPAQRVRYELQEIGQPTLKDVLSAKFSLYRNSGNRL
jgi:predicted GTPase